MARKTRVEFGDYFHCGLHRRGVGLIWVQRPIAMVFVDVPHTLAVALRRHTQQNRAVVRKIDRWEPSLDYQIIAVCDVWTQPLDDERACKTIDFKLQAIHPCGPWAQVLLSCQAAGGFASAQYFQEQSPKFGQTGLAGVIQ